MPLSDLGLRYSILYEMDDVICMACLATMAAAFTGFVLVMTLL